MSTYRIPDLHGPRYRRVVKGTHNKEMYAHLREKVPGASSLSDAVLQDVLLELNYLLAETVLDTREGIELPNSTGHLFIGSCNHPKKGIIDHKASAQSGQLVTARNWHTNGLVAKIFYSNVASKYRFKHHELWGFDPARKFTRLVGQLYPTQFERYIQIEPDLKTKSTYAAQSFKLSAADQRAQALATYDELAFD